MIYILFLAFFIRTVRNAFYQVFLWQIKEYRFDRMLAHLKTWQGKRMAFGLVSLAKWGLLVGYFVGLRIFWPVVFVYVAEGIWELREFRVFGWKRPVWTVKTLGILGCLGILGAIASLSNLGDLTIKILLLDKAMPLLITFLVYLFYLPTQIQRRLIIDKAKKIIKNHPDLLTVGITGSYGKTSTKEFLAQILSAKFRVLKTEGSKNTEIGVAKTIVKELKDQEIFVCEMGAYKIGEIREIGEICKPEIGIITGINEQHLDLFGSLKKTMEAKYELIESLPQNGLAVFNGSNQYCLEMAKEARKIGKIGGIRVIGEDIGVEKIKITPERLEFEVVVNNEKQKMSANLLGKQNIENILAAITVAKHLGMSLTEISEAVKKLEAPERTMRRLGTLGSLGTLIDDTFNANPDGVLAALEYMKVYTGKKILVLTPMIELGEAAGMAHEKVGQLAGEVCDLIILTNKNYYEDFIRKIRESREIRGKILIINGEKAAEKVKAILDKDGVVVFEGKESKRILEEIKE